MLNLDFGIQHRVKRCQTTFFNFLLFFSWNITSLLVINSWKSRNKKSNLISSDKQRINASRPRRICIPHRPGINPGDYENTVLHGDPACHIQNKLDSLYCLPCLLSFPDTHELYDLVVCSWSTPFSLKKFDLRTKAKMFTFFVLLSF